MFSKEDMHREGLEELTRLGLRESPEEREKAEASELAARRLEEQALNHHHLNYITPMA